VEKVRIHRGSGCLLDDHNGHRGAVPSAVVHGPDPRPAVRIHVLARLRYDQRMAASPGCNLPWGKRMGQKDAGGVQVSGLAVGAYHL